MAPADADQALALQLPHEVVETLADLTEDRVVANLDVVERELGGVARVHAELLELARDREPGKVLVDEEERDAMGSVLLRAGARDQQDEVAAHAVGDVELAAVDPPVAVDALGAGSDAGDIAAGVGLGDAEGGDLLAPDRGREVALLLLLGAPPEDGRRRHLGVDADRHPDATGTAAGHLLREDDGAEVVTTLPAVSLGVPEPEQAELAHPGEHAVREAFRLLPLVGVRAQLPGDEVTDGLAKRVVLSREMQERMPPWAEPLTWMSILSRAD